jgi:hypothetical protein
MSEEKERIWTRRSQHWKDLSRREGKKQEGGKRTHGTGRRKQDKVGTESGYKNEGQNKEGPGGRIQDEGDKKRDRNLGNNKEGTGRR